MNTLQEKINLYFERCVSIVKGELQASFPGDTDNFETGYWEGTENEWKLSRVLFSNLMKKRAEGNLSDNDIAALWNAYGPDITKPESYHPAGGISTMDGFSPVKKRMTPNRTCFAILKDLAYNTDESTLDKCNSAIKSEFGRCFHSRLHRFAATFNSKLLDVYNDGRFESIENWFARYGYYVKGRTWFQKSLELQAYIDSCVTYPEGFTEYEKQYISILFGCYLWWIITEHGKNKIKAY